MDHCLHLVQQPSGIGPTPNRLNSPADSKLKARNELIAWSDHESHLQFSNRSTHRPAFHVAPRSILAGSQPTFPSAPQSVDAKCDLVPTRSLRWRGVHWLEGRSSTLVLPLAGIRGVRRGRRSSAVHHSCNRSRNRRLLCIPGIRPLNPGILALLRDRALGRLAQVSKTAGGIYGLSPCRTDHPTLPTCARGRIWPKLAFYNPFSSSGRRFRNAVLASSYHDLSW